MIRVRRSVLLRLTAVAALGVLGAAFPLRAQSTNPATTQSIPAQTFTPGAGAVTLDLRNYFTLPNVAGQVAQIDTVRGKFNIELLASDAPKTVANFLSYVNKGAYTNTLFHRSVPNFIIQAGGFSLVGNSVPAIPQDAPVQNEFKVSNTRGTLAMAKLGTGPNTATNQWFVNLADNRANLDNQNGGFTVFARVLGTGMSVADNIASFPVYNASQIDPAFTDLPLTANTATVDALIIVRTIKVIPVYPAAAGDTAVLSFSVINPDPTIVTAAVAGPVLTLTPGTGGSVTVAIRATDVNGNFAENTLLVTNNAALPAPKFVTQPLAQTVATGSTVVFSASALGSPVFQWWRNGTAIPGATAATLVLPGATAANAGTYSVVATNSTGTVTSDAVALTLNTATATEVGRLVNLSILTGAGTGAKILTVGASIGPLSFTNAALPLVVRGVGPTLKDFFGISTALDDPTMTVFAAGNPTAIGTNDNWGSGDATVLAALFRSIGAFDLTPGSLDSAFASLSPGLPVGGYTVQVAGKGTATGTVIAEIYDASGNARTAATPRLVNLSTRAQLDAGGELRVGFVLRGLSARTVLIRAVGPSLVPLGVTGVMADPKLELFDNDHGGVKLGENDNWGGDAQIVTVAGSVGAFALSGADTKDAVLLITLPAGAYSARLSGVGGTGGTAIVEVYEVP